MGFFVEPKRAAGNMGFCAIGKDKYCPTSTKRIVSLWPLSYLQQQNTTAKGNTMQLSTYLRIIFKTNKLNPEK